jgi:hypothetical protein
LLLYGAGNGQRTVIRGTLPWALYGRREYAAVMCRLARLPILDRAITPVACGYISEWLGLVPLLYDMPIVAMSNLGLPIVVFSYALLRTS